MKTLKMTYSIIEKETFVNQKTFSRTVNADSNAYNIFEEEAEKHFDGYKVEFNHPGRCLIISEK